MDDVIVRNGIPRNDYSIEIADEPQIKELPLTELSITWWSASQLSQSETSCLILNNPLYNAPGGEDQQLVKTCPDFNKTRHRKPFLGVCRRSTEKRELLIAFLGIYDILKKCDTRCF